MSTRAKFTCNSVTKRRGYYYSPSNQDKPIEFVYDAEFSVVTSGSEENKQFFAATPSGTIKLSTYLEDQFEVGKNYYIDFHPEYHLATKIQETS